MKTPTIPSGCTFARVLVDQAPVFDRKKRGTFSRNQVSGKSGILRSDKRKKVKFI